MPEIISKNCNDGACSICRYNDSCHIINSIKQTAKNVCRPLYDEKLEFVIYRCPEFVEC